MRGRFRGRAAASHLTRDHLRSGVDLWPLDKEGSKLPKRVRVAVVPLLGGRLWREGMIAWDPYRHEALAERSRHLTPGCVLLKPGDEVSRLGRPSKRQLLHQLRLPLDDGDLPTECRPDLSEQQ